MQYLSKRLGFMEARKDVGNMISTIGGLLEASQITGLFPTLVTIQLIVAYLAGKGGSSEVADFTWGRIREAKQELLQGSPDQEEEGRHVVVARDFCSKLLAMTESDKTKKTGSLDPDLLVLGACTSNVFAGSDTTSITLTATLFNIITRPGATICGTWFPAGTNVGINSWVAHRNLDVWGPDADEFRPERWLESSEEQLRRIHAMFMPFGLGSRTCLGKNISLLEISN